MTGGQPRSRFRAWLAAANTQKSINGWLCPAWLAFGAFGAWTGIKNSLPVLFFISVYANFAGHLSTWQAGRVEVKQEEAEESAHLSSP